MLARRLPSRLLCIAATVVQPVALMASEAKGSSAEWDRVDWKARLTPEQYYVARQGGTERPWSSTLNHVKGTGDFNCVCCGTKLFTSSGKFDSGSGWPSFFEPAAAGVVEEHRDVSHGMVRTEVRCATCKAHLGHVFEDGPRDKTGLRYCINGITLDFKEQK